MLGREVVEWLSGRGRELVLFWLIVVVVDGEMSSSMEEEEAVVDDVEDERDGAS